MVHEESSVRTRRSCRKWADLAGGTRAVSPAIRRCRIRLPLSPPSALIPNPALLPTKNGVPRKFSAAGKNVAGFRGSGANAWSVTGGPAQSGHIVCRTVTGQGPETWENRDYATDACHPASDQSRSVTVTGNQIGVRTRASDFRSPRRTTERSKKRHGERVLARRSAWKRTCNGRIYDHTRTTHAIAHVPQSEHGIPHSNSKIEVQLPKSENYARLNASPSPNPRDLDLLEALQKLEGPCSKLQCRGRFRPTPPLPGGPKKIAGGAFCGEIETNQTSSNGVGGSASGDDKLLQFVGGP